ncbi:MAG: hypothetical protein HY042_08315 [Spirochaetia bacterium]|nr:hypothetical protein [Spirochaetia bacterium]
MGLTDTGILRLLAACAALFLAPMIQRQFARRPVLNSGLWGFAAFGIAALVLLEAVPYAWEAVGPWALVIFLAGALLPWILEFAAHQLEEGMHGLSLALGLGGLLLHNTLDGAALLVSEDRIGIALAVILHRVVEGAAVWLLLRPRFGRLVAIAGIALLCAATAAGYLTGAGAMPHSWLRGLAAFVGGMLLHALFHRPGQPKLESRPGFLAGGVLAVSLYVISHLVMH